MRNMPCTMYNKYIGPTGRGFLFVVCRLYIFDPYGIRKKPNGFVNFLNYPQISQKSLKTFPNIESTFLKTKVLNLVRYK